MSDESVYLPVWATGLPQQAPRDPEQAAKDRAEELAMKQEAASAAQKALAGLPPPCVPHPPQGVDAASAVATGMSRCTACGIIYDGSSDSATTKCCFFHPGTYLGCGAGLLSTKNSGWSCCGRKGEDAKGCRGPAFHIPCAITMSAMQQASTKTGRNAAAAAPFKTIAPTHDPSFARLRTAADDELERTAARTASSSSSSVSAAAPSRGVACDMVGKHEVCAGESIGIIAMRHSMRKDELLRLNGLLSERVYPGQVLLVKNAIPVSEEEATRREAKRKVRAVVRAAKIDMPEAQYYLDIGGHDVGRALALHAEDVAWEEAVRATARPSARETAEKMAIASAVAARTAITRANLREAVAANAQIVPGLA